MAGPQVGDDHGRMPASAQYALILDGIVPLDQPRVDYRSWQDRDWGQTLRIADWHRLSPSLFSHLEPRGDAPAAVHSALEKAYLASSARSLFLLKSRREIVDALDAAGVPALLLKGSALVETAYPDPALREMLDLDILVPTGQLAAASASLADLGYRPEPAANGSDQGSVQLATDQHHGPALVGSERLLAVELHQHLTIAGEGRRFDIEDMWRRASPAGSGAHLLPASDDLLLHVCLHFTRNRIGGSYRNRHTGGALAQISDVARIVEGPVDWERLSASARSYGLGPRVFLALFAARELGVAIPPAVIDGLRPAGFDQRVGRRLVALRVLRDGDHLPARTLRWMFAPSREVLSRGWSADPTAPMSLARAYMRRARAHAPHARSALTRPWTFVQDQRLNGQVRALEERL